MINNFSNTEKSLKRYLKEKVTITTATVVSFLIAGTVAMAAQQVDVTINAANKTGGAGEKVVNIKKGGDSTETSIAIGEDGAVITLENWKDLVKAQGDSAAAGALNGLVTVSTKEGVTTIAGVTSGDGDTLKSLTFGGNDLDLGGESGDEKILVAIGATEKDNIVLAQSATVEGADNNIAIAMGAAGKDAKVTVGDGTNATTLTVKDYAIGLAVEDGGQAEVAKDSTVTVADTDNDNGVGVLATGEGNTLSILGTITGGTGTAIAVEDGDLIVTKDKAATVTGDIIVENGTLTYKGKVGAETFNLTGSSLAIDGIGTDGAATGNVVTYTGALTDDAGTALKVNDTITTGNINFNKSGSAAVDATLSNVNGSSLDINSGVITLTDGTGIKVTGAEVNDGTSTATVNATLGTIAASKTAVEVEGKKGSDITVNFENAPAAQAAASIDITGTGAKVAGAADGKVTVNVNQDNLKVAGTSLVDVTGAGEVNVNVNKAVDVSTSGKSIVATASTGTTNIDFTGAKQVLNEGNLVNVTGAGVVNVELGEVELKSGQTAGTLVTASAGTVNLIGGEDTDSAVKLVNGITGVNGTTVGTDGYITLEKGAKLADNSGAIKVVNDGNVTVADGATVMTGADGNTLTNNGTLTLADTKKGGSDTTTSVLSNQKLTVNNYGTIVLSDVKAGDITDASKDGMLDDIANYLANAGVTGSSSTLAGKGFVKGADNIELYTAGGDASGSYSDVDAFANTIKTIATGNDGVIKFVEGETTVTLKGETQTVEEVEQYNVANGLTIGATDNTTSELTMSAKNMRISNIGTGADATVGAITVDGTALKNNGGSLTVNYTGDVTVEADATGTNAGAAFVVKGGSVGTTSLSYAGVITAEKDSDGNARTLFEVNNATLALGQEITNPAVRENVDYKDTVVNGNIVGTGTFAKNLVTTDGNVTLNGNVEEIGSITVNSGIVVFGANSKISQTGGTATTIDLTNGNMGLQLGEKENQNMLATSGKANVQFKNLTVDRNDLSKGKIEILTDKLTENTTFELGTGYTDTNSASGIATGVIQEDALVLDGSKFYTIEADEDNAGKYVVTYNKDWLLEMEEGFKYAELYEMAVATQSINDLLSGNEKERVAQLDDLYSNNIFSETVKMSMDTLRLNERAVLLLDANPEAGKWAAAGKAIYSKSEYDREGVTKDFNVETENVGLMGAVEYGLSDSSSVGFAFSGVKQDLDMGSSDADGDAFYFGLYRKDNIKNFDLTTGFGYQTNSIDANNITGSDEFDSEAFSAYMQGKYNVAINDTTTVSPLVRVAVTRFNQDSANTGRMKMEEVEGTYADVEFGVEAAKKFVAENGTTKLLAGVSYVSTVGDTDEDYRVDFISNTGTARGAKVKGAELSENTLRLNVGADYENVKGFLMNAGVSYEFDNNDRDSVGVTLGAGYKF